jgi:hypothetical protein
MCVGQTHSSGQSVSNSKSLSPGIIRKHPMNARYVDIWLVFLFKQDQFCLQMICLQLQQQVCL